MKEIIFSNGEMDCRGPGEGNSFPFINKIYISRAYKKGDLTPVFTEISCSHLTHDQRCSLGLIHSRCPRFNCVRSNFENNELVE